MSRLDDEFVAIEHRFRPHGRCLVFCSLDALDRQFSLSSITVS